MIFVWLSYHLNNVIYKMKKSCIIFFLLALKFDFFIRFFFFVVEKLIELGKLEINTIGLNFRNVYIQHVHSS